MINSSEDNKDKLVCTFKIRKRTLILRYFRQYSPINFIALAFPENAIFLQTFSESWGFFNREMNLAHFLQPEDKFGCFLDEVQQRSTELGGRRAGLQGCQTILKEFRTNLEKKSNLNPHVILVIKSTTSLCQIQQYWSWKLKWHLAALPVAGRPA